MRSLHATIGWRLSGRAGEALDPRVVELVALAAQHGSLAAAARAAGLPYRTAWALVAGAERTLGQRLMLLERNVLARHDLPVGRFLYGLAAAGGARAIAQPTGAIAPGRRADLVVLDADEPALAAQSVDDILDAAIFGPCRRPVRDAMVGGRWVVREGRHPEERAVLAPLDDDDARSHGADRPRGATASRRSGAIDPLDRQLVDWVARNVRRAEVGGARPGVHVGSLA